MSLNSLFCSCEMTSVFPGPQMLRIELVITRLFIHGTTSLVQKGYTFLFHLPLVVFLHLLPAVPYTSFSNVFKVCPPKPSSIF